MVIKIFEILVHSFVGILSCTIIAFVFSSIIVSKNKNKKFLMPLLVFYFVIFSIAFAVLGLIEEENINATEREKFTISGNVHFYQSYSGAEVFELDNKQHFELYPRDKYCLYGDYQSILNKTVKIEYTLIPLHSFSDQKRKCVLSLTVLPKKGSK